MVEGEAMTKDIYDVSEQYSFDSVEEGVTIVLFEILKELKTLNKTLKQKEKQ
jgi:hypothetical protein